MIKIELYEPGLMDTLNETIDDLKEALTGNRKQKDYAIYKTLGVVNTLYRLIQVTEIEDNTKMEMESDE